MTDTVIEMLAELAPECIMPACPKPLAIGVEKDLVLLARQSEIESHELIAALKRYTSSTAYLEALRAGAPRIGIDGRPAEIVSTGAAAAAREATADRIIANAGRNRRRRRNAATPRGGPIKSFRELGALLGRTGGRR